MKRFLLLIGVLVFSVSISFAQSAKKYNKIGEKQLKENQANQALASFTAAIKMDPNLIEAYVNRANVHLSLGNKEEAIEDLDMINKLDPKDEESWLKNAKLNFEKKEYAKAATKYIGYLNLEPKELPAYDQLIAALKNIEDYTRALQYAKKKLDVKETPETHFEIANLYYILKNFTAAETSFREAIKERPANIDYRNGLALALYHQNRFDAAIGECNVVLQSDKNNKRAFLTRANSYHKKIEYSSAITDMSKVILLYPNDDDYLDNLNYRADLYLEFTQHMNAIAEYSKVISKDGDNIYALNKRAQAYEEIANSEEAKKDYAKIISLSAAGIAVSDVVLSHSKNKLYELNRETQKPLVQLENENFQDGKLRVAFSATDADLLIKVSDENEIKSLLVDGEKIKVDANNGQFEAAHHISIIDRESVEITAKDTYGNEGTLDVKILKVENDPPMLTFLTPYVNESNEIILNSDDSRVYFEGNIQDESHIKSIIIDEVIIPFNGDDLNPAFSTNMDLRDKTQITVEVTDIYDNVYKGEYYLNREAALYAASSPMGKTWVIFLENSDYETFASLDGPVKDVRLIKEALANYEVHNIIHKSNLTKQQMERFFHIELRDIVKENNINSLVVWYAGHGKFQNETGYWIPVDADRTDEFSFFNINTLKASMQVYAGQLTHTLVITDACESGPSFYQAMRNDLEVRTCADEKALKFKSSQVFSSAGLELASDNSQFTRTFANTLINNEDPCLPIESIVLNVGEAVAKDNQQKPQFGKIAGLEDENGTFFFIRKDANFESDNTSEESGEK